MVVASFKRVAVVLGSVACVSKSANALRLQTLEEDGLTAGRTTGALSQATATKAVVDDVLEALKTAKKKGYLFHVKQEELYAGRKQRCAVSTRSSAKAVKGLEADVARFKGKLQELGSKDSAEREVVTKQNGLISGKEREIDQAKRDQATAVRKLEGQERAQAKKVESLVDALEKVRSGSPAAAGDVKAVLSEYKLAYKEADLEGELKQYIAHAEKDLDSTRNLRKEKQKKAELRQETLQQDLNKIQESKSKAENDIRDAQEATAAAKDDLRLAEEELKAQLENQKQSNTLCAIEQFEWEQNVAAFEREVKHLKEAEKLLSNQEVSIKAFLQNPDGALPGSSSEMQLRDGYEELYGMAQHPAEDSENSSAVSLVTISQGASDEGKTRSEFSAERATKQQLHDYFTTHSVLPWENKDTSQAAATNDATKVEGDNHNPSANLIATDLDVGATFQPESAKISKITQTAGSDEDRGAQGRLSDELSKTLLPSEKLTSRSSRELSATSKNTAPADQSSSSDENGGILDQALDIVNSVVDAPFDNTPLLDKKTIPFTTIALTSPSSTDDAEKSSRSSPAAGEQASTGVPSLITQFTQVSLSSTDKSAATSSGLAANDLQDILNQISKSGHDEMKGQDKLADVNKHDRGQTVEKSHDDDGRFLRQLQMLQFALKSTKGPFDKVKRMIADMIARLMTDVAKEQDKKAMCKVESNKAEAQWEHLSEQLAQTTKQLDGVNVQLPAISAKLQDNQKTIQDAAAAIAAETQARATTKAIVSKILEEGRNTQRTLEAGVGKLRNLYESTVTDMQKRSSEEFEKRKKDAKAAAPASALNKGMNRPAPGDTAATHTKIVEPKIPVNSLLSVGTLPTFTSLLQTPGGETPLVQPETLTEDSVDPRLSLLADSSKMLRTDFMSFLQTEQMQIHEGRSTSGAIISALQSGSTATDSLPEQQQENTSPETSSDLDAIIDKRLQDEHLALTAEDSTDDSSVSKPSYVDKIGCKLATWHQALVMMQKVLEDATLKIFVLQSVDMRNEALSAKYRGDQQILQALKEKENAFYSRRQEKFETFYNQLNTDWTEKQKELVEHEKYMKSLKESCNPTGLTPAQKSEKREREIDSLKEAMKLLTGEEYE